MNKKNKRKPIKGNKFNYGGFGSSNIFNTPQVQNIQPMQPQLATVQPNMPSTSQISSMMQQTAAANPIQQASGSGLLGSVGGVGGAVGIAQGAAGLATQIANNLSVPEIKQEDMTAKSKGDLFTRANEFTNSGGYKVGRTNPLTSGISGLATGASAGMALSPMGGLVGGLVGGIGGTISSIFGNNKKKKAERKANRQTINAINGQNLAINEDNINASISQQFNYGGVLPITTDVESQLALNSNNLFAYGGDFNNGITSFEGGGTHEENPYGGILQGMGDNGMPNLVEEGEVKWNDYIFSNRLTIPEDIEESLLPKSLRGKSYADAAEYLQKESKERELDPISKIGLNTNLMRLAQLQEANKPEETSGNEFKDGGNMKGKGKVSKFELTKALTDKGFTPEQVEAFLHIAQGESGFNLGAYRDSSKNTAGGNDIGLLQFNDKAWPNLKTKYDLNSLEGQASAAREVFDKAGFGPWYGVKNKNPWGKGLTLEQRKDPTLLFNNRREGSSSNTPASTSSSSSTPSATTSQVPTNIVGYKSDIDRQKGLISNLPSSTTSFTGLYPETTRGNSALIEKANTSMKGLTTVTQPITEEGNTSNTNWLRYAPLMTNLGLLGSSMASSPDKLKLGRVGPQILTEKMRYNPIDSEYLANQMRQQAAATNRSLVDTSGGNRGIAQASLIAANRGSQTAIADALMKANELNDNKLARVKEFNRSTDMFNIGNDFQAQQINTSNGNQERFWNKQADAARRNEIRQGIAGIGNVLGQIGTENRLFDVAYTLGGDYGSTAQFGVKEKGLFSGLFKNGGKVVYKRKIK